MDEDWVIPPAAASPTRPHFVQGRPVRKDEVVRVLMIETPENVRVGEEAFEWDDGEFRWSHNGTSFLVGLSGLRRELEKTPFATRIETVIDKLLAFHKVFLILPTGEIVFTATT